MAFDVVGNSIAAEIEGALCYYTWFDFFFPVTFSDTEV